MSRAVNIVSLMLSTLIILSSVLTGCSSTPTSSQQDLNNPTPIKETQFESWLTADAKEGFNAAIDRDYRRLTIISGSLKKMHSTSKPELDLGIAIGALESTIFTQESEYRRMDNNINISAEVKREIVPAGLLNALNRNRQVLEHVYQDILKPYAEKLAKRQPMTVEQEQTVDKAIELIFTITQNFSKLSQERSQMTFLQVEALINELEKLQAQLSNAYFPLQ